MAHPSSQRHALADQPAYRTLNKLIKDVYCFYNNKGGVGKTTLAFHTTIEYAAKRPELDIIAMDMCPQANYSYCLLTKYTAPAGFKNVKTCMTTVVNGGVEGLCPTVVGYIQAKSMHSTGYSNLPPQAFLTRVSAFNPALPNNIYLLCGDPRLENTAARLADDAKKVEAMPIPGMPTPFAEVHQTLRRFLNNLAEQKPNGDGRAGFQGYVGFVDTNPALSIYTQIAIATGTKAIVPLNPDDFSREALRAMLHLVWGQEALFDERFLGFKNLQFSYLAKENNVPLPRLHLFVSNKLRPVGKGQVAKPIQKMLRQCYQTVFRVYRQCADIFVPRLNAGEQPIPDEKIDEFVKRYFTDMRDMATAGLVSTHLGLRCSQLLDPAFKNEIIQRFENLPSPEPVENIRQDMAQLLLKLEWDPSKGPVPSQAGMYSPPRLLLPPNDDDDSDDSDDESKHGDGSDDKGDEKKPPTDKDAVAGPAVGDKRKPNGKKEQKPPPTPNKKQKTAAATAPEKGEKKTPKKTGAEKLAAPSPLSAAEKKTPAKKMGADERADPPSDKKASKKDDKLQERKMFSLMDLEYVNGDKIDIEKKGTVVVVHCGVYSVPEKLSRKIGVAYGSLLKKKGISIVALSQCGRRKDVQLWLDRHPDVLPCTLAADVTEITDKYKAEYKWTDFPAAVVMGKDGRPAYSGTLLNDDEINQLVEAVNACHAAK